MIAFILIAAAMVAVALAWLLVPLLRHRAAPEIDRGASNVALLRDQLREIDSDVANGTLSAERAAQAKAELELRVLDEAAAPAGAAAAGAPGAGRRSAFALAVLLPVAAIAIYLTLGTPGALSPEAADAASAAAAGHDLTPAQMEDMAARLAAKLEKEPANTEGWVILARTYYVMKRHAEASRAFERAVALAPDVPELLADYADVLAAAQGGNLAGKPTELVNRALALDPTYWKALALAGTAAFRAQDYASAVMYWERLKATVPADSPLGQNVAGSIAEARQLGGLAASAGAPPPAAAAKAPAAKAPAAMASVPAAATSGVPPLPGTSVSGSVKLAPAIAAKAAPGDLVFIFARPAEGSKMPLAILRKEVKDLPLSFTLDDSMAMTPEMKLSNFPQIVVGARVSKSGNAIPAAGDLEGVSAPLKAGTTGIAIVIDSVRP